SAGRTRTVWRCVSGAAARLRRGITVRRHHRHVSPLDTSTRRQGMNEANGKVALVTGAGSGIGKAVALELLRRGYRVVLAGRRAALLEQVRDQDEALRPRALAVPTDVSDEASVDALFARVREEFGRLDVLFNNAGRGAPAVPIEDLPVQTWREVV